MSPITLIEWSRIKEQIWRYETAGGTFKELLGYLEDHLKKRWKANSCPPKLQGQAPRWISRYLEAYPDYSVWTFLTFPESTRHKVDMWVDTSNEIFEFTRKVRERAANGTPRQDS